MAYSSFKSLSEIESKFGVKNRRTRLFADVVPLEMGSYLKEALSLAQELPVKSEKAKSELIVTPILIDLRIRNDKYFTFYSGEMLNPDEANGLNGECDFIMSKDTGSFDVSCPIVQIVEAKRNDTEIGIPQCAAQMIGARLFNQNSGVVLDAVYGCVTTGDDWLFMKLVGSDLFIDTKKYYLGSTGELLAVFQVIIDEFKNQQNET
jgi:hypothetical protein